MKKARLTYASLDSFRYNAVFALYYSIIHKVLMILGKYSAKRDVLIYFFDDCKMRINCY